MQLRTHAQGLRVQAGQRQHQELERAGGVEASSLEQLFDLVFTVATRVAPSADAITSWYEQAVANERQRRQHIDHGDDFVPVDAPITHLQLTWRNGTIDVSESRVNSSTQSTPGEQAIDTDADFAAAVATERSAP